MKIRFVVPGLLCLLAGTGFLHAAAPPSNPMTLVLYDSSLGTLPDPSFMGFTAFPPESVSLTYTDGTALLDSTLAGSDAYAGWVSNPGLLASFPVLDRAAGVQLNFTLQLESESHSTDNRAGLSVIVLDRDARGIELSFWENEIWTQNDDTTGGLFTHGEGVVFAPTSGMIDYQLTLRVDTYTLTANAVPILTGPIRDYSNFEGFLDPYETPNFLFVGDDTTSAQSRIRLRFVSITGTQPAASATAEMSTNLPPLEASPVPSATPFPTPTPSGGIFEICPFGWLLPGGIVSGLLVSGKLLRRKSGSH